MKNILSNTKMLAALLMAGAAFTACSEKDNIIEEQPAVVKTYKMVVDASIGDDTKTRALYFDGSSLKAKWASTDQVRVFKQDWSAAIGTLTATASETATTTLTGDVTGAAVADNLNLLFPRATWDYTGQKGILLSDENSIEKKYDYATAQVTVTGVSGSAVTTNAANFKNQQAIVKFNLLNGTSPLAADKLTISAASNKLVTNKSYRGAGEKTYYFGEGYYTVTAGSGGHSGEEHGKLVDNDLDTKWCQDKPSGNWYIEFHTASAIQVDGYMLRTGGDTGSYGQWTRNPQDWVLKGKKNSGDGWTDIDTKSGYSDMPKASNAEKDFDVDVPGEYQYFRLEISNNIGNGGAMQLSEMRLFKYNSYEMGTSYGDITVTPDAAASELTVALRNENAGADTYTLTATVGTSTYSFEKSGVNFENGKYYSITVKMQPKKVSSITLNKSSINLTIGSTQTLSVSSVAPADAVDKSVTWSSSATGVATVNATTGEVNAVAEGTATITATANDGSGTTATCSVNVYPAGTVVWDQSNWGDDYYSSSCTIGGITLTMSGEADFNPNNTYADFICDHNQGDGNFTFTAPTGKKFTKIEINAGGNNSGWSQATLNSGWSKSGDNENYKVTWTGNANSVSLFNGNSYFENIASAYSILFLVTDE